MHAVLLDFNGTMFFDTRFHMEAWSKIYHELHPEDKSPLASTKICGPCNDVILKNMAPWLTPAERQQYSEKKEFKVIINVFSNTSIKELNIVMFK